jgi:glycosyltransferase involved in cell wall biosynthesis
MISIIVTAYKNTSFIKETLESILVSCHNFEYEILVGVDNCVDTINFLKTLEVELIKPNNIKILFFTKKSGTYIIRNTLASISSYDKLLFFDSDDLMTSPLVSTVIKSLEINDYVRYRYITFKDNYKNYINNPPVNHYHVGTFGINKNIFMYLNGFEPWDCAADGEFFWRISSNNIKIDTLDIIGLYYRKHSESLTSNPNTGMNSPIRKKYHDKKKEKQKNNHFGPLENLVISDYVEFTNSRFIFFKKISIIIPTYGNSTMLSECLNSIQTNNDYEILVGIDGCQETLDYVKNNKFNENIKLFYFEKNVGPYIVKNSLSNIGSSDILLFFDSDDIMKENMIPEILEKMKTNEFVKPMYVDFTIKKNPNINKTNTYGEGVFAIKKELFLSMNGFEPWPIAADSDFMARLYKNKIKFQYTDNVVFYRRIHPNSLTQSEETGLSSKLRGKYFLISKNKTNFNPLPELFTSDFYEVFTEKEYKSDTIIPIVELPILKDITPILKNEKTIDYDRINDVLNKNNTKTQIPQTRISNPPNNRNEINQNKTRILLAKESIKKR